jgi:hypothetical protein
MKIRNENAVRSKTSYLCRPANNWFWSNLVRRSFYLAVAAIGMLVMSCTKTTTGLQGNKPLPFFKEHNNKVILDWNIIAFETMGGATYSNTLVASRLNAMVHIAMHDALNSIVNGYQTYALKGTSDAGAHPIAAAATAAYYVLVNQFPEQKAALDAKLETSLAGIPDGAAKQKAFTLGKAAAEAILAVRANDGAFQNPIAPVPVSNTPGVYQTVPPFDFVFAPFWTSMQTFGLINSQQFRSVPPPSLTSARYTKDFNEVKEFGKVNSTVRTAEQTFYGKFWYEFSEIGWNRIARVTSTDHKLDLLSTARLFALLNISLADSYTAGWESKFHYNFWRPYTAIHRAATDGNNNTDADTSWQSLMPTPPVQDYPSTHSVLGNAGAVVLTYFFGNTDFTFTSPSADPANASRTFKSFMKAADENADSRVRAGLHFRFATDAGQEMGNRIGKYVLETKLLPK